VTGKTQVDGADVARLIALAALWGASFIFMRVLAPALGPLFTATSRVFIAGMVMVAYARVAGFDGGLGRNWRRYAAIGVVGSAIPFALFSFAALRLPASYMAILNAATPFFVLLLSARFTGERLTWPKVAGLGLGFAGVALVSGAGPVAVDGSFLLATGACLGATFCYAANAVYIRPRAARDRRLEPGLRRPRPAAGDAHRAAAAPPGVHARHPRQHGRVGAPLQRARLPAVLPADRRHRSHARADGDLPHPVVRHALGSADPGRDDHLADGRGLPAGPCRHRVRVAQDFVSLTKTPVGTT
jgi:uncharacterized membrane protein